MSLTSWIQSGYDAIVNKNRRRPTKTRTFAEDKVLPGRDRIKAQATARDVHRNFAIARWAIGKHLDFVSSFSFQAQTGDPGLDRDLETLIGGWSNRHRCDIARRHPFRRMIRLAEARRTVDGDFAFLKIAATPGSALRGKLQAIESDRICTPSDLPTSFDKDSFVNGVQLQASGAAAAYAICKRTDNGAMQFSRVVDAKNVVLHAYYDRFDQIRGISPLISALNSLQDVYEGFDYALAKIKVAQMFGLATYREDPEEIGDGTDTDSDGKTDEVNFGRGPFHLDLDTGDKAEFLEAKTPAAETTAFLQMMIHVSLKSLDIPFSFFDESHTNFYGSRGALIQYLKGCRHKIEDLREALDEITRWRLGLFVADGELTLPSGFEFNTLNWEWVPDGIPWWDPEKEVKGQTRAIAAGLTDYQRVSRESGTDFFANIDRIAEQQKYAKDKGVDLNLGLSTPVVEDLEDETEATPEQVEQ